MEHELKELLFIAILFAPIPITLFYLLERKENKEFEKQIKKQNNSLERHEIIKNT